MSECNNNHVSQGPMSELIAYNCFNAGSDNGLLPDGTKPLSEPMLRHR